MFERRATSRGMKDLEELLTEDQSLEQPIFTKHSQADYRHTLPQGDSIFRKVATPFAKVGYSAFEAIDKFQRGTTVPNKAKLLLTNKNLISHHQPLNSLCSHGNFKELKDTFEI